jgi:hypothetical protein
MYCGLRGWVLVGGAFICDLLGEDKTQGFAELDLGSWWAPVLGLVLAPAHKMPKLLSLREGAL